MKLSFIRTKITDMGFSPQAPNIVRRLCAFFLVAWARGEQQTKTNKTKKEVTDYRENTHFCCHCHKIDLCPVPMT